MCQLHMTFKGSFTVRMFCFNYEVHIERQGKTNKSTVPRTAVLDKRRAAMGVIRTHNTRQSSPRSTNTNWAASSKGFNLRRNATQKQTTMLLHSVYTLFAFMCIY